jgi:hypothetical protein
MLCKGLGQIRLDCLGHRFQNGGAGGWRWVFHVFQPLDVTVDVPEDVHYSNGYITPQYTLILYRTVVPYSFQN